MFVKLYLGPTCAALNRPHGVAHCSQHVWPAVPFQNVIYLKIQFSLHKVYELYHFVFSFSKASTTRLMHYNDIPRYPILLQASKIVPRPLVSASRELGVIPGSLDSRAGHPPPPPYDELIPVRVRPGSRAQSSVISLDLVLVLPTFFNWYQMSSSIIFLK